MALTYKQKGKGLDVIKNNLAAIKIRLADGKEKRGFDVDDILRVEEAIEEIDKAHDTLQSDYMNSAANWK
jgi:hypothetical protein